MESLRWGANKFENQDFEGIVIDRQYDRNECFWASAWLRGWSVCLPRKEHRYDQKSYWDALGAWTQIFVRANNLQRQKHCISNFNMWEPASQAHYAIFEPLSGATVERLPSTVPSLINDLFFVLSHMPHARKRLGSVCFVDSLGITRSGLRVIHNPNYRNWCMFSPQYWRKLRAFERRNWYERIEFLTLGSLFSAFAKAQSLRFTTMEVYLSDDRISRKRLTKFLSDNMIDAAKMPKH